MPAKFGPSGNTESFYEQGNKSSVQMPGWLKNMGLDAYEYQCNKGVNIGEATARKLGDEAAKHGISLSIHAPYYINLSSQEKDKRINSRRYILESLKAAKWMGATRVVIHPGSCSKIDREWATCTATEELKETLREADAAGLGDVTICPELLGKMNQLGSLEEIIAICRSDDRLIPTIDFGHLHARGMGALKEKADFDKVLDILENSLGSYRLKHIHAHFSRIEYSSGGEKKHWTLADTQYGPEFEPLAELIYERDMEPVIICESRGNMAEDALKLKNIYLGIVGENSDREKLEKGKTEK